ncbi:hypothetical protein Tco_1416768 [Tanacetum coccineum]
MTKETEVPAENGTKETKKECELVKEISKEVTEGVDPVKPELEAVKTVSNEEKASDEPKSTLPLKQKRKRRHNPKCPGTMHTVLCVYIDKEFEQYVLMLTLEI